MKPTVVTLCGSTRFRREYEQAFRAEEHAGRICLTVPCYKDDPCCKTDEERARLDELHLAKIDMSDEILVVNPVARRCLACDRMTQAGHGAFICFCGCERFTLPAPYVGDSTRREIAYAEGTGKRVRYLNQPE